MKLQSWVARLDFAFYWLATPTHVAVDRTKPLLAELLGHERQTVLTSITSTHYHISATYSYVDKWHYTPYAHNNYLVFIHVEKSQMFAVVNPHY